MSPLPFTLNALQLRWYAEAASGYRGIRFWVTRDLEGVPGISTIQPHDDVMFCVETNEVEERPKPRAVIIDCDGSTRDLTERYDAVFWSEAAVEKFLFPYYASKYLWDAAAALAKLSFYWYGTIPVEAEDESGTTLQLAPYAIAHTPDSDWNTLSTDGIGPDLHLLVKHGDVVRAVRLADLTDPPSPAVGADRARRRPAATDGA